MLVDRRTPGRAALMVAVATFDPNSRSLRLSPELEDREAWITVALAFCSLLLFGLVAS